ncbi:CBPA5 Carboxypeptidase, partial [Pachyramphus minor]|nr:CBPA5 Carboxypeptidase [Pachyramphus minor]
DQVLRITARDEEQVALLRVLGEQDELQVDFWRHPSSPRHAADLRVPFPSLRAVRGFLESHGFSYTVMIEDMQQELLDEEKEAMVRARRVKRSSRTFDFGSYHTLDEV